MRRVLCGLFAGVVLAAAATAETPGTARWPVEFWDPAAETDAGPADLVLPLPCGAAMAFQRVDVPVDPDNPLDDRRLRLGQSDEDSGFSDYLHQDYLRGAFTDADGRMSYYYIARYELTTGQYRALMGNCADPARPDRLAQGGLSWFDAVDLGRRATEWLMAHAADQLPHEEDARGFLRLPTETEWEFAVRGGIRTDAAMFPGRHFFADGAVTDFALVQAAGSGRGKLGPVGLRKPNPLGLFDVYGNAEELMLDPYRFNALGRAHGQAGGLVTRGRSVLSGEAEVFSAARDEYPVYNAATGVALAAPTFGLRLVISTQAATSDARLTKVRDVWDALASRSRESAAGGDALATLGTIIDQETDPKRQQDLTFVLHEMRLAREQSQALALAAASTSLLAGAVLVETLGEDARQLDKSRYNLSIARDMAAVSVGDRLATMTATAQRHAETVAALQRKQGNSLVSYRSILDGLVEGYATGQTSTAAERLVTDLSANGQSEILGLLRRFLADLETYRTTPDMDLGALRALALSP